MKGAWKRSTKRHEAYNEENDISIKARRAAAWRSGNRCAGD